MDSYELFNQDDVIKWKHFPRHWPFMRGIHRPPVNSPHKGQWRGALMSTLICARINGWVNNREAGDLRCHRAHYDVIVMPYLSELLHRNVSLFSVKLKNVDNYIIYIYIHRGIWYNKTLRKRLTTVCIFYLIYYRSSVHHFLLNAVCPANYIY